MKKLLLIIALTIFGLGLNAQNVGDVTTIGYVKFEITSVSPAECRVSYYTGEPTEVTIPSTVTISGIEYAVTSIGNGAFFYCSSLTSIEIPNSVTSIGDDVFYSCSSLTSIEIPNSVTSIGWGAFEGCSSLTSIEIPNSVTSIGERAFSSCSSLTSIVVAEGNTVYDSRDNCNAIIETSSNTLIAGCQNTIIPNSVTSIESYAFVGCSSLTSIEIPNSVTSIGDDAFSSCSSLTSITFGENSQLTSIGDWAFSYCSSLKNIEIPNSVTSIGDYAFEDCESLTSVTFEENSQLTSIGYRAFWWCSSLTSIEIPNSVTYIGMYAFNYCSSLRVIKCYAESVPETVDYVFYHCPSAMIIYVPEVSLEDYKATSPWNEFTILSLNEGPRNITATTESVSSVNLSWDNCYADSYNVYRNGDSIANVNTNSYLDNNLEPGTEYCYTVTAVRNETETDKSEEVCAKTFDLPITTPENLVAEALSASSIELTWDGVENALSYNVYQSNELIANVEDTTFTVDGLEYNTEYCYTFTAVRNETESDKSEEKCAKTFDLPITTPENLIANVLSTSSIILTWDNVENALSYNVYRDGEMIINVTNTNYTDNNLEYNTEYCYTVTAVRNETETDKSEEKCVKTFDLPITTPTNLVAEATGTSSISLTWNAVENALSYNIYNGVNKIANVITNSYEVNNLNYYTDYCFTVTAVRNETETENSEPSCATTFDLPITTPKNLVANVLSTSSIILTWDNVENALSYNVYRDGEMIINVTNTNYTDKDLEYNTKYCYTVTAVRNDEESDKSEEKCAKTFDLPITTPENLIANVLSTSSIILTWDNVENALSYNVYRDGEMIINVTNTNYTDNNLEYNTEYCYTVTAVRGDEESEKSSEACATTMKADDDGSGDGSDDGNDDGNDNPTDTIVPEPEVLAIPENLEANALSASSIILTWDNVENALSYNVYRDGDSIANVTNPTYTDKDLEYNTEYCYTVTAVGDDDVESEESEEVCVKTLGESIEELSSSINIYPNPVDNELFLATELRVEEIAIYDVYGRQTMRQQVNETTSQQVVDVADLDAGVYFVNIKTENGNVVKRFVKN